MTGRISIYLYNADGKICAVEQTYQGITVMTGYIYDADGNRVAKGSITSMSCYPSAMPWEMRYTRRLQDVIEH
jgi:hypothetical protein